MEIDLKKDNINSIIVKDEFDEDNSPKKLLPHQVDQLIEVLNNSWKDQIFPHLKFIIEYKNGEKIEIITEGKRAKIGEDIFTIPPFHIYEEYPFVKIANYHDKIEIQYRLLEMKLNSPTKRWLYDFSLLKNGDIYTTEGLLKAEDAFNRFVMNLFYEIDKGLTKQKAYSFVKELYNFFYQLEDDGLIDLTDRDDVIVYANQVLFYLNLYDEDLANQSYWQNWLKCS